MSTLRGLGAGGEAGGQSIGDRQAGPLLQAVVSFRCTKGHSVMMLSSESVSVLLSVENAQDWLPVT